LAHWFQRKRLKTDNTLFDTFGVPDSKSRDQIGKETDITLHQYFIQTYGEESSLEFQSVSLEFKKKNFFLYPSKGLLI
jgi:hypothetical protein